MDTPQLDDDPGFADGVGDLADIKRRYDADTRRDHFKETRAAALNEGRQLGAA